MPAEPELPPVEAMLREAARERRDAFDAAGPGVATMPGPTRARLHEALARRFDAPARESTSSGGGLARWWLAFAGAAGAAAVAALFTVANQQAPERPAAVAARSTPTDSPKETAHPAPAPVAPTPAVAAPAMPEFAAAPADRRRDDTAGGLAKTKEGPPRVAGILRAQTFTQIPIPLAASAASRNAVSARRANAPAVASAPAPGAQGGSAATGQASAAVPAQVTPLLENFRFEQRGENVRVVDADGSVYVGQVEADKKTLAPRVEKVRSQAPAAADHGSPSPQETAGENFRFRAIGDNRTLRKPVVFEGEYSTQPLEMPAAKKSETKADAPASPSNSEAQIRGRVRVLDGRDGQRPAEVDARSVRAASPE